MERRTFITWVGLFVPAAAYAQFSGNGHGFRTGGGGTGGSGGGGAVPANLYTPTWSSPTSTTATITVTSDTGSGTVYGIVTTNSSTPSATQVIAGLDAASAAATYAGSVAATAGSNPLSATGLSSAATYYYFFAQSSTGGNSTVIGGGPEDTVWLPTSLTGLVAWFDASVYASFTLSGANVTAWADQSGLGSHVTNQGTGRPVVYSATGFNGSYPGVTTGSVSNGFLETNGSFPMGTGNTLTAFYAGTMLTGSASPNRGRALSYAYDTQGDWNSTGTWAVHAPTNSLSGMGVCHNTGTGTVTQITGVAVAPAAHTVIATINSSGLTTIYIDGVASTPGTVTGNWVAGSNRSLCLFRMARCDCDFGYLTISEAGVATGYSDATTVANLHNYLKNKWGMNPVADFLARTSGLDTAHTTAYTMLINGLYSDGVWQKFDVLYIFAAQDSTTAALNLVSSSYNATVVGGPTFTADRGFTGVDDSSASAIYIDSGFNPSTATAAKASQNSMHLSVWNVTNVASAQPAAGNSRATNIACYIYPKFSGDSRSYFRVNSDYTTGTVGQGPVNSDGTGHYIANRSTSSATQGYKAGVSVFSSGAETSQALSNSNIYTIGNNDSPFGAQGAGQQIGVFSVGGSLTAAQALAFYSRVNDYMTAMGVVPASAEATAFLARTSGLDAAHTMAYTILINGLVADGVWAKLDVLRIYATQDSTTALLNLVSSSYAGTIVGSPTFTADRGFTGVNGSTTVYINSNFNPSTASSPKYTQNSCHLSQWSVNEVASNPPLGYSNGSNSIVSYIFRYSGDNNIYLRPQSSGTSGGAIGVFGIAGHWIANRSGNVNGEGYWQGVSQYTGALFAAGAILNLNIYELAQNANGTASGSGNQYSMISIGSSLTATEALAFYKRIRTYLSTVGVP